ncbi:MAG: IS21-like element helper ATPase IstB [Terrimicrobiaceae bacterium]
MLTQPTIDKLNAMRLYAMAQAFQEQVVNPNMAQLSFQERFGLIVDHQMTVLENTRMQSRLKAAKLRLPACIEDLDFRPDRGMDRSQVMSLTGNQWVRGKQNILITGPTGAGKSYMACALAQKACRDGHITFYQRTPRLFHELAVARHDGRYLKLLSSLGKCEVLILDDFLLSAISRDEQKELLEIIEDRYGRRSTIVTSQLPIKAWHDAMQDPTMADAILDRLVHNGHKIELAGDSMRKRQSSLDRKTESVTQ